MTPKLKMECHVEYRSSWNDPALKTIRGTLKTNNLIAFLNGESETICFELSRDQIENISEVQGSKLELIYDRETIIIEPLEYVKEPDAKSTT